MLPHLRMERVPMAWPDFPGESKPPLKLLLSSANWLLAWDSNAIPRLKCLDFGESRHASGLPDAPSSNAGLLQHKKLNLVQPLQSIDCVGSLCRSGLDF